MIAPRMCACTRSPSSRARQRLSRVRICLVMIPCLRWITATLPPLHAAECDARMRMKFNAAFPNLPNDSCTNGTRTQRSVSNGCCALALAHRRLQVLARGWRAYAVVQQHSLHRALLVAGQRQRARRQHGVHLEAGFAENGCVLVGPPRSVAAC